MLHKSTSTPSEAHRSHFLPSFKSIRVHYYNEAPSRTSFTVGAAAKYSSACNISLPTKAALLIATTHFIMVGDIHFSESRTEAAVRNQRKLKRVSTALVWRPALELLHVPFWIIVFSSSSSSARQTESPQRPPTQHTKPPGCQLH